MVQESQKTVLVAMSGGVDSSVTACLLKRQGYKVIGGHLRLWKDKDCEKSIEENIEKVQRVASEIGIPIHIFDFKEEFISKVVNYFLNSYKKGETPNPCIECNKFIKFGLLIEKMHELGADFVATGHYARKITTKRGGKEVYELHTGMDNNKDQSYFLYRLTQEKLKHILFPIGGYGNKSEIRKLAEEFGIDIVNKQKESQNVCFYSEKTHNSFLQRNLSNSSFNNGRILTVTGENIGTHSGLPNYTIGQRKGLGIGGIRGHEDKEGQPWYVVRLDALNNALIVGQDKHLQTKELVLKELTYIDENQNMNTKEVKVTAKIRSHFPKQPATFYPEESRLVFDSPQRAITPGQSTVFYDDTKVLGGGIILSK